MRSYPAKENHIGLAVNEILRYKQKDRQTSYYFIIRMYFLMLLFKMFALLFDCFYKRWNLLFSKFLFMDVVLLVLTHWKYIYRQLKYFERIF